MALIRVFNLSFAYDDNAVLKRINLKINTGERLVILGGNGSGKSTLAHLLAGWLPENQGVATCIQIDDRSWNAIPPAERVTTVQFVGQIPMRHLSGRAFTVQEEIAFGLENLNLPLSFIRDRIAAAMQSCNLTHLAERDPFSLSGGEQQRLLIASALALQPRFLILDEPLTNLDPDARAALVAVLRNSFPDTALIQFETNPDYAMEIGDRFAFLQEGEMKVEGTAREVLLDPLVVDALGLPSVTKAYLEICAQASGDLHEVLPLRMKDLEASIEKVA